LNKTFLAFAVVLLLGVAQAAVVSPSLPPDCRQYPYCSTGEECAYVGNGAYRCIPTVTPTAFPYPTTACTIPLIPDSEMRDWCNSNGYTPSGSQGGGCVAGASGAAVEVGDQNQFDVFWLIFLVIGLILGYLVWGRKKKRK
jgi:hypothetical protein